MVKTVRSELLQITTSPSTIHLHATTHTSIISWPPSDFSFHFRSNRFHRNQDVTLSDLSATETSSYNPVISALKSHSQEAKCLTTHYRRNTDIPLDQPCM
ncbi:hypothetical protein AMS68_003413 [Peltaster fructicola]|uniref:Uncharacterized protein n=1 Tax=Peltaster fructicola TaxID=286661 RepID=A0A6H0XT99_9PEZI|nr:hypothetical protein AMS68_003413 [Peltaster fructicola]